MSKLVLTYEHDRSFSDPSAERDDFGFLTMAVSTEQFSGRGGFWVQWQDVKEFGESLSEFPINADKPLKAQWGYAMQEGDDLILSIHISPADVRGNLLVRVEIADQHASWMRIRTSFETNYPDLMPSGFPLGSS